jgi:hypothetical protein
MVVRGCVDVNSDDSTRVYWTGVRTAHVALVCVGWGSASLKKVMSVENRTRISVTQ